MTDPPRSEQRVLTHKRLSVVIACYRDEGSLREFYRRLMSVLPTVTSQYEIIFVNDASPDDSEVILRELQASDSRVVIVNHTRNFGSQNAFLSGMSVSKGEGVILMDGDLQDPPSLIPDLVRQWLEGYEIVYGRRVSRKESPFRRGAYKLFYRVFRHMASVPVPVDAGDFGLMDRKVVSTLLRRFPEQQVFLRGLRAYTGYRSVGVDYIRDARFDGRSTNSLGSNIGWAKLGIFSFSKKPLHYISRFAVLCVALTVVFGLLQLVAYFVFKSAPEGWMTITMLVLILGSVQLVCLAIIAEYVAHMYDELKQRPRYIVRDVVDGRVEGTEEERTFTFASTATSDRGTDHGK